MNKLQQLIEAAKAATPGPWDIDWYVCYEDGIELWRVPRHIGPISPDENHWAGYHIGTEIEDTDFITLANPATILELCALLKKAEEGLHLISLASQNSMTSKKDIGADARCALAAIKQWKEQT